MSLFDFNIVSDTVVVIENTHFEPTISEVAGSAEFNADFSVPGDDLSALVCDFSSWGLLSCLFTVLFAILLWGGFRKRSARFRDVILRWGFVSVWVLGFLVYDIGTCTGEWFSLFTNAPMAALHSLEMFLLESDVSAIHDPYHESWLYMAFFSLAHVLAAIVSTLFIIKHFGFHILSRLRMWRASLSTRKWDETYVFWGLNEATFRLIDSIKKKYGNDDKSYCIIVVRTNRDDDDTPEKRTGFSRVFDFLSLRNSELDRLKSTGCLSTGTYADFSKISLNDAPKGSVDTIGRALNLRTLKKLLDKKTRSKIHMLFLSDNESDNLHDVALLRDDKTITEFSLRNDTADNESKVIFYCHARYNSVHRVVEDINTSDKITVRVIDSSHINVEMLKRDNCFLPVNFVDVDKDATVSSPFNALVIGFSEVGQDSARFLYEFGAFVKSGSTDDNVERSEFHLHVVDTNMSDLAGTFVANAPAIKPSLPFINGKENKNALITMHEMDCRSVEFYFKLEESIKRLNYVVIATDDDELNISLGVRIFKLATRYRKNLEKFCILVRAHNDDDGHIFKIAEHYNRLWAAQKAAGDYSILNQTTYRRDEPAPVLPIHLFGLDKEVYTYDNIIDDTLEKQAIQYKEAYEASTDPEHGYTEELGETAWMKDFREFMQLDELHKSYYSTYAGLMKLRRAQGQDFANCLHQTSKELLAKKALKGLGKEGYDWTELSRKGGTTTYTSKTGKKVDPDIVRILDVLAQTEHLRWNASHEILGYRHTEKSDEKCDKGCANICKTKCDKECNNNLRYKDEVRLLHNCLRDWQNLNEEKRSYDYNVVDITLNIINKDNPIKKDPSAKKNSL